MFNVFILLSFFDQVVWQLNIKLLPPAYVVRGKVIFILGNVCLFTIGGGITPCQVWVGGFTPPRSGLGGRVPFLRSGWAVPHPRSGGTQGTPWPGLDGGVGGT